MDTFIAEGVDNKLGNWESRKATEHVKVWTRWEGTEFNSDMPVVRAEHYFPDIDDPEVIFKAFVQWRREWDDQIEVNDELTEFTNDHTVVNHVVNKSVIGTQQREFIDKKIYFRTSDVQPDVDPQDDEIYMWVTSAPNELHPVDPSKFTRADTLLGIQRMGRRKDGKPGCYLHAISQTDVKVGYWTLKILYPIFPKQMSEWGVNFRAFLNKKTKQLAEEN